MLRNLTSIAVLALITSASAPTVADAADKRVACRTETQKMAHIIIRTRGRGGEYAVLDKARANVGEDVWNAMLAAYQENPRVGERDLATFGYSACVAHATTVTK